MQKKGQQWVGVSLAICSAWGMAMLAGCETDVQATATHPVVSAVAMVNPLGFAVGLLPTMPVQLAFGDLIALELSSSQAGFAHLYVLSASGKVQLWAENIPIGSGKSLRYPAPDEQFVIRASPPTGDDRIILVVTKQASLGFGLGPGQTLTRPLNLPFTHTMFIDRLHTSLTALPADQWSVTDLNLHIAEASTKQQATQAASKPPSLPP